MLNEPPWRAQRVHSLRLRGYEAFRLSLAQEGELVEREQVADRHLTACSSLWSLWISPIGTYRDQRLLPTFRRVSMS